MSDTKALQAEVQALRAIVRDLHWMARRYADGRQSYATSLFNARTREAVALGVPLNPAGDGTIWAADAMGALYAGISESEHGEALAVRGNADV